MTTSPEFEKTGSFAAPLGTTRYACLLVQNSPDMDEHGLQFILLGGEMMVGRAPECAIVLKDPTVSRRHATLSVNYAKSEPRVHISNLSQEGATSIGDQALSPRVTGWLRAGDELRLGQTVLRYVVFDQELMLSQHINTVVKRMREARYDGALGGLAALKKHRPVGGTSQTALEQLLLSATYYEARIQSILGKWSRAAELFRSLVDSTKVARELRVKAAFQLGVLCVHQNDLAQTQALVDHLWSPAEEKGPYFLALILCLQGMVYARHRDFSAAMKAFDDASKQLRSSVNPSTNLSSRILLEQGVACFLSEQYDLALKHFELLNSEVCVSQLQKVICAEALRYRGVIASRRRDFEEADSLLRDALRIFQETKSQFLECKAQKSRAFNYLSRGRLEEALVHLQLCQKLLSGEVENEYERAVVAAHLGKVYLTRGDAHEALRWFEQERSLQNGLAGVEHSQAYTHWNFARAHRNLGHTAEATTHYERAAKAFEEFSNPVQQAFVLVELCRHRIEGGDLEAAATDLAHAQQCFSMTRQSQGFEPRLDALRGEMAWAQGDHLKALEFFAASIRALEQSPPSYVLAETYLSYGQLCVKLFRHKTEAQDDAVASEYFRQAKLLFEKGIKCAATQSLGYLLERFRKEIEELDYREFTKLILSRFINPEPLEQIINNNFRELNRFQLDVRTVIFVDLSGYTAMVEKEQLAEVRDILNEFYGFSTRIIQDHNGAVDKFIGDCVMAVFKGPTTAALLQNQAVAAVNATLAIMEEVEHLAERRFSIGRRKLAASAGICTGKLLVGLVGSLQQMDYTCIGDVVNVASRLQGLAQPGEVLVAHETYQAYIQGSLVPWTHGDIREARVKNREQPVRYWSLARDTRMMRPAGVR